MYLTSDQLNTFLSMFVITFGWVLQQTHPEVMTNMLKKVCNWSEVHLSEVTFYKIHTLIQQPQCLQLIITVPTLGHSSFIHLSFIHYLLNIIHRPHLSTIVVQRRKKNLAGVFWEKPILSFHRCILPTGSHCYFRMF